MIIDNGGPVIKYVEVQLIFWGNAWMGNPSPSISQIQTVTQAILASNYLAPLTQYRGAGGSGNVRGTTIVTSSQPPSPCAASDCKDMVDGLIDDGTVPTPADEFGHLLYVVVLPVGVSFENGLLGDHFYDQADLLSSDGDAFIAAVTNDGSLDSFSLEFSHELAESCTDPTGDAIQIPPYNDTNWHEICDVCQNDSRRVNGILLSKYWSEQDQSCVVPDPLQTRWQISCINKAPRADAFHSLTHVGGIGNDGQPFRFTRDGVIALIKQGNSFFVVGSDGSESEIGVHLHYPPGHEVNGLEYISTGPDRSKLDNLLSLPECT